MTWDNTIMNKLGYADILACNVNTNNVDPIAFMIVDFGHLKWHCTILTKVGEAETLACDIIFNNYD